jgi:hypothetical protein
LTGLAMGAGAGYLLRRRRTPAAGGIETRPAPPRPADPGVHGGAVPPEGGGAGPVLGPLVRPASLQGAPAGDALVFLAREHDELRDEVESLLAFEVGGAQELELKRILQALDSRRHGDIDFEDLLRELRQVVADHVAFEEGDVWPGLDAVMTAQERLEMGRKLGRAEELAPTRPHPSELADPSRHPALSRAVSLLDRGVDRVAARGRGPHD